MKLITKALLLSGVTLFAVSAHAESKFAAGDKSPETRFCISAAEDSKMRFTDLVKHHAYPMKVVAQKLECNGQRIASFARDNGNLPVFQTLSRYDTPTVKIYQETAVGN